MDERVELRRALMRMREPHLFRDFGSDEHRALSGLATITTSDTGPSKGLGAEFPMCS